MRAEEPSCRRQICIPVERRFPTGVGPTEIRPPVRDNLPRLKHLPALITWGDRDPAFREKERRTFEEAFPNHTTHVLKGAGHYIQEDSPEEICEALRSWWKTTMSKA